MLKLALLLAAFCVVGTMDFNDEKLAYDDYCEKVAEGTWQAYKGECTT